MPQQNREEAGVLSKPVRELTAAIKQLLSHTLDGTVSGGGGDVSGGGGTAVVDVTSDESRSTYAWQITGTWTGTLVFEASYDLGLTWYAVRLHSGTDSVSSTTANGLFVGVVGAATTLRVRASVLSSGTAEILNSKSKASAVDFTNMPLPSGTNLIGQVNTEMPDAVLLSDALANPTSPLIGSCMLGWDPTALAWERLKTNESGVLLVAGAGAGGAIAVNTELPDAALLSDAFANPTAPAVGACMMVWDEGSLNWLRLRGTVNGISAEVTNVLGGTIDVLEGGPREHGQPITPFEWPLIVGGYADDGPPLAVDDGDAVMAWFTRNGALATSIAGTAGELILGNAANGLDVDVTRVKPDGTNVMPSLDTVARAGFVKLTDGTNTAPTMDAVARKGFQALTDGSLVVGVVDETGINAVDAMAVGGGTPHDSVDSGNPVKVGGKAFDFEPGTNKDAKHAVEYNAAGTATGDLVEALDRANFATNLWGDQITGVRSYWQSVTGLDTLYNSSAQTDTSDAIPCWFAREATLGFSLAETDGTTTRYITIDILCSLDGGSTYTSKLRNGPLAALVISVAAIKTGGLTSMALRFPVACHSFKVRITAETASWTSTSITVSSPQVYLRT